MNIALGMDASQVVQGFATAMSGVANFNQTIAASTVKMAEWNVQANKIQATFQATTAGGQKILGTYAQDTTGATAGQAYLKSIKVIQDTTVDANEMIGSSWEKLKSKFLNIAGVQIFKEAIRSLISNLVSGAQSAIEFEIKISEIRTIAQDMPLTFNQWATALENLSNKFGVDQLDVAAAAYETLSNQVAKGAQVFPFLTSAIEFGRVTQSKSIDSVNLLTSALNSFQLNAEQAERVSAVLFKTIELGRIRASDLSNTFGRVAQMGHTLGVSLEETSASLVVLTNAGIKPAEAMTLVTNLMQKLLRPSDEMKKLLQSWGTPTAEAAIATFGYVGVLQKLEAASKGSSTELANLFHEIRAGRAATGLSVFGNLSDTVNKLKTESEDAYAVAKKITEESPGRTLQKEFTTIKNFFVDDFGRVVLGVIADFSNRYLSLSGVITTGTKFLLGALTGWGLYKTAVTAATAITAAFTGAQTLLNIQTAHGFVQIGIGTRSIGQLAAAYGPLLLKLGAVAVAGAAVYKIFQDIQQTKDISQNEYITKLQNEAITKGTRATTDPAQQQADLAKGQIDIVFKAVLDNMGQTYRLAAANLDALRDRARLLGEDLRVAFDMGLGRLKEHLGELTRGIGDMRSQMKTNDKFVTDFGESLEQNAFNRKLAYANDGQQLELLTNRYDELIGKAQRYASQASDTNASLESRKEAFEKFKKELPEALQILGQLDEKIKEFQMRQAQQSAAANQYYNGIASPNPIVLTKNLDQYFDQLKKLYNIAKQGADSYNDSLERTIKNYEELSIKEKARIESLQLAAKDFFEVQKGLTEGTIFKKPEFQTPTGGPDVDKAVKAWDDAYKRILSLAGANAQQFLEFHKKMEEDKTLITKLATAQRGEIEIKDSMNTTIKMKANLEKAVQDAKDAQDRASKEIFAPEGGALKGLQDGLEQIKKIFSFFGEEGSLLGNILNTGKNFDTANKAAPFSEKGFKDIKDAVGLLQQLDKLQADLGTEEGVKSFIDKFTQLQLLIPKIKADLQGFSNILAGQNIDLTKMFANKGEDGKPAITFQDVVNDLQNAASKIEPIVNQIRDARKSTEEIKGQLGTAIQTLPESIQKSFEDFLLSGNRTETSVKQNFTNIAGEISKSVDKVIELRQTLEKQLREMPAINVPINIIPNQEGPIENLPSDNEYFASGGSVRGPRGTDNIPAWLTKGEFVMNKDATKQFYSTLVAMNSSVRPGYYSQGGYVTTNVGDINVNVTGTGSPERDVRAFAVQLRRELKRGTIKLS